MHKSALFILLLLGTMGIYAQEQAYNDGKLSPYTAHFISSYKQANGDTTQQRTLQKRFGLKRQGGTQAHIDAFIELEEDCDIDALKETFGITVKNYLPSILMLTASIPADQIEPLALHPSVKRVEMGIPVETRMDKARPAGGVDKVHEGIELPYPYTGKDVVIGIIDGGFQYDHVNFYTEDKSTLRVKRAWDQNSEKIFTTAESIIQQGYDQYASSETHGTHVAGIASGSNKDNDYYGVAPEADLLLISYDADNNVSITDAIAYVYEYADSVGKPAVVNMSLGTHYGPHDGTSTFDRTCDALQGEGKLLVGAVGNEGQDSLHLSKTFSPSDQELKTFLAFNGTTYYSLVDIWSEENQTFSVEIIAYDKTTGQATSLTEGTYPAHNRKQQVFAIDGAENTVTLYTGRNSVNKKANASIATNLTRTFANSHYIGIKITAQEGTVHAWADNSNSYFSGHGMPGWTSGNSNNSMGEIGGTGKRIISVGAYTTAETFTNLSGATYSLGEKLSHIAGFSSCGPTADGRMKPDITAPGTVLISSFTDKTYSLFSQYRTYVVQRKDNAYYGAMQGTSMASPYVAGVLATWLQADPTLTPEKVKEVLNFTATTDSYTGNIAEQDSNTWGYGKIDAWNGLKQILFMQDINSKREKYGMVNTYQEPGSQELTLHLYSTEVPRLNIRIYTTGGQCALSQSVNISDAGQPIKINVSTLTKGIYTLHVSGDNVSSEPQKLFIR